MGTTIVDFHCVSMIPLKSSNSLAIYEYPIQQKITRSV